MGEMGSAERSRRSYLSYLSAAAALVVLAVFIYRGEPRRLLRQFTEPRALRPRVVAPAVDELAEQAAKLIPARVAVQYHGARSPVTTRNEERFAGDPRPRPEADVVKETIRYALAPRIVYARGPFEPPLPPGLQRPRYVVATGAHLSAEGFQALFENAAGGVYVRKRR